MIKIVEVKSVNDVKNFNEIANNAGQNGQTHGLLVKMYADWCGHCQSMKDDWDALTRELKTHYECKNSKCNLTIANIRVQSMDNNDKIMANLKHIPKDIQGVPSIMFVSNGKRVQEYTGERVFADMIKWIINNNNFPLKKITSSTPKSSSQTIRRLIKNATPTFKEIHSKTLRQFNRKMRAARKAKSVKSRTLTPGPNKNNNNNNNNIPAYLK